MNNFSSYEKKKMSSKIIRRAYTCWEDKTGDLKRKHEMPYRQVYHAMGGRQVQFYKFSVAIDRLEVFLHKPKWMHFGIDGEIE